MSQKQFCEDKWFDCVSIGAHQVDIYPNLHKLCQILLCFNVQNAVVERGFR